MSTASTCTTERGGYPAGARRGDLRFPVEQARLRVPVGIINPSHNYLAGDLRGDPAAGAGLHWWARLSAADLKNHQLPDPAGPYHRPPGW
jgi:hypothetical protein